VNLKVTAMLNFKKLEVWRKAMELVKEVYVLTKHYPKEELYGLTGQTRRSAVSVPSNIAEGVGRKSKNDTARFLYISRGSAYELATLFEIAAMCDFIEPGESKRLTEQLEECVRLLNGLINYFENERV
jgi:four helix bundle protein